MIGIEVVPYFLLFAFLVVVIMCSVKVANQWDRAVVFRLGRYCRTGGPGLFLKFPFVETVAQWVSIQTRVVEIQADKTMTKDTVPVTVATVLYWKVVKPDDAVINVTDYEHAIQQTAQIALREAIGAHSFTDLLIDRVSVDKVIREAIQSKTINWGIDVEAVEIKDVQIPDALQNAMSQEAQAEREKHARVILGTSEIDIAKSLVEAAIIYESNDHAMELRKMNMVYEMRDKGSTIILPSSLADAFANMTKK